MNRQRERITWRPELLERRFEHLRRRYPEYFAMLSRALGLRPGQRVIDVGCGSGAYARLLATEIAPGGQAIGVDLQKALLTFGRERASEERVQRAVAFIQGDAMHLPLADNGADLVFCNTLLWVLPEPEQAILEMIRVVKPGGLVCASDVDGSLWVRYDEDSQYLALTEEAHQAFMAGVRKLYGADFQIGRKLPSLFRRCGLIDLQAYPRVFVNLACDFQGRSMQEVIESYEWRLGLISGDERANSRWERTKRIQMAGGMSEAECEEYRRLQRQRLERSLADPWRVRTDTSLTTWGGLTVIGRKQ